MLSDETRQQIELEINQHLEDAVKDAVESAMRKIVERIIENKRGELNNIIHGAAIDAGLRERMEAYAQNEISNRLRCAVYDGSMVQRVFDSIWPVELDRAIEDRIKWKLGTMVEDAIKARLKKAFGE